jgi:hypothetical protein
MTLAKYGRAIIYNSFEHSKFVLPAAVAAGDAIITTWADLSCANRNKHVLTYITQTRYRNRGLCHGIEERKFPKIFPFLFCNTGYPSPVFQVEIK